MGHRPCAPQRFTVVYLFATKTIDRIQATVIPGNTGSQPVPGRSGLGAME